jgi:ubiquinone/menaquinone biosynthesis C-methylase UbiE
MLNRFFRQFSGPSGPLGRLAGRLMARLNGPLNDWAVDLLELSPRDRVLEVGYGPGLAIQRIASRASQGRVVGVDRSERMRRQAARRNRAAPDELRRVLRPQGRLLFLLRMRREGAGRFDRSKHGMTEERLATVVAAAERAGFRDLKKTCREIRGETLTAVLSRV